MLVPFLSQVLEFYHLIGVTCVHVCRFTHRIVHVCRFTHRIVHVCRFTHRVVSLYFMV